MYWKRVIVLFLFLAVLLAPVAIGFWVGPTLSDGDLVPIILGFLLVSLVFSPLSSLLYRTFKNSKFDFRVIKESVRWEAYVAGAFFSGVFFSLVDVPGKSIETSWFLFGAVSLLLGAFAFKTLKFLV